MGTLTTTAAQVDATGINAPVFADIYDYFISQAQAIYGSDIYIPGDSQDGILLGLVTKAINDGNALAIAVWNQFSPVTAVGAGLASNVKLNGITKHTPSNSTANILVSGDVGKVIGSGVVRDTAGYLWDLPTSVTIPSGGSITVTATCETAGAIAAAAGTINQIVNQSLGWNSAVSTSDAAPGAPVESDATLRIRQAQSVALPSKTVLDGIVGAVAAVPGVTRYRPYNNDTASTDANGIPSGALALVVQGGDAIAIATAILTKKSPGGKTYGSTTEYVTDVYGIAHPISFSVPSSVAITVAITIKALAGYTSNIGVEIQNAVAAYINALPIGQKVMLTRLYLPANLNGSADSATYEVTALTVNSGSADVTIALNQVATMSSPSAVTLTVT